MEATKGPIKLNENEIQLAAEEKQLQNHHLLDSRFSEKLFHSKRKLKC
jgi:hypothetical protein